MTSENLKYNVKIDRAVNALNNWPWTALNELVALFTNAKLHKQNKVHK